MENKLIKILEEKYPEVKFKINRKEFFIELIYDNKSYIDDTSFRKDVLKECINYLDEDDIYKLAIVYDFLNENNESESLYSCDFDFESFSYKRDDKYYKKDLSIKINQNIHLDVKSGINTNNHNKINNWNQEIIVFNIEI